MHTPLVGRHRELQALVAACRDEAGAVFVRGDAGVGKSSLLAAALAEAELLGARVLQARFNDLDRHVPYAGLRAALSAPLAHEVESRGAVAGAAAAVASALDLSPGPGSDLDPQARLAAAFEAGRQVLAHWARDEMVVLALDDLHAADPDSLRVLGLLVAHLTDSRFTVLGTLRSGPGSAPEVGALVERLAGEGLAQVVDLAEFDRPNTRAVVHSLLGARPGDDVVEAVWESTAGNAFYVVEAVRGLEESGRLGRDGDGVSLAGGATPITLSARASLLHRIFDAGPDARTVLRLMTALERITLARLDLLAEVSGLAPEVVDAAFDRLVAEGLLHDAGGGAFQFVHPIVKATLYEDLGPAERRRIHQRLAATLQRERDGGAGVGVAEIAAHLAEAAEPGDVEAARLLVAAGQEAYTSAPLTAAEWLVRAAGLLPVEDAERGEVLALASRALLLAARAAAAAEVGAEALALLPPGPRAARTAAVVVQALASLGRFDEALAVADAQLASAERAMPRVQAMRATVLTYLDRFTEAEEELELALEAAVDDQTRSVVLGAMATCQYALGDLDACFRHLDDQEQIEVSLGPGSRLASLVVRSSYLALSGSLRQAQAAFEEASALSDSMGGSAYRAALDTTHAVIDWLAGDWDGVVEASRRIGVDPDRAGVYGVLARVAELVVSIDRGQFARARELADEVGAGRLGSSFATWAVARLDAALGDVASSRSAYRKTLESDQATGRRSVEALLLASLLEVDVAAGDETAAQAWADQLTRVSARSGPLAEVLAFRARAWFARDADLAREALAVAERNGLAVERARCLVVLGHCVADPTEPWTGAYEALRAVGAEPETRALAAAMRDRGVPVPRSTSSRRGELTDTEREIARLVHEGLTNRQIARILFLSPKTIEVYLGRVFAKTGNANRLELALAVGQGLLDDSG